MSPIVRQYGMFRSLMASTGNPPFLSFLIAFLSISTNGISVQSTPCGPFDCGNGLTIGYPFWRQKQQAKFCGYPNFAVSCTNNQPIFHLSDNSYLIKNFSSTDKTLTISYYQENEHKTCPIATHNFALEKSISNFLNYTKDNKLVHFYYNCTVYPPSVTNIKCLQRGAQNSYAFVDGSVPEFDWVQHCESIVTVSVIEKAVDELVANGSGDVLTQGFKLAWKSVDNECDLCEANGGYCGYNSSSTADQKKFFCLCSDGNDSQNCHNNTGKISVKSRPNYEVIGAIMIFGGVFMTVLVVTYFISKRKISVQKHGFSQIPSNYGK